MTITAYQVDSVINSYNKQLRMKKASFPEETKTAKYQDVVSLSQQETDKAEAFKKISYSLLDMIRGGKENPIL